MTGKPASMIQRMASLAVCLMLAAWLAGCAASPTGEMRSPTPHAPRSGQLTPFSSRTPTLTRTPTSGATPTPLPSPTPTPRTHTVAQGQDMFGIAWMYGITLEELKTANPTVNPNLLSIGAALVIPASNLPEPTSSAPTPTPIPLETGRPNCTPVADGGAWCFWPVRNPHDFALENISGLFQLAGSDGQYLEPRQAFLPLDVLPPGASLPLMAYYPPPLPEAFQASAELLTVMPNPAGDGRYLPAVLEEPQVRIAEDGQSAEASASLRLESAEDSAGRAWVAAVAYDADGNVAGVRRWENTTAGPIAGGQSIEVVVEVYSLGPLIARVELLAEARP